MALIGGRLLNEAEEGRKPLKGTCTNCKRKDIGITPLKPPFCWTCYTAGKGLTGEEREKALAEAKDKIINADIKKVEAALKKQGKSGGEAEKARVDPDKKPAKVEEIKKSHKVKGAHVELHIIIQKDDESLYDYVKKEAKKNRRTIQAQVLYILDLRRNQEARELL